MTSPTFNWEISLGTVVQVLVLIAGMAVAYGQFDAKVDDISKKVANTQQNVKQIQHYLSESDSQYWHKVAENGDAEK